MARSVKINYEIQNSDEALEKLEKIKQLMKEINEIEISLKVSRDISES